MIEKLGNICGENALRTPSQRATRGEIFSKCNVIKLVCSKINATEPCSGFFYKDL